MHRIASHVIDVHRIFVLFRLSIPLHRISLHHIHYPFKGHVLARQLCVVVPLLSGFVCGSLPCLTHPALRKLTCPSRPIPFCVFRVVVHAVVDDIPEFSSV